MSEYSKRGNYSSPEGSRKWEYFAAFSCALLIFCLGSEAGWNSPTLSILMSPLAPVPLSAAEASSLTVFLSLGQLLAPILTPIMAAKLGGKRSLIAVGIPVVMSWGLIAITQHIVVLSVARCFGGLALGLGICIAPIYLGEIASAKMRGAIGMVCSTMLTTGAFFMFVIVPHFSIRTSACVCLGIVTCALICLLLVPESPYYLAMIGEIEEAEGALEKLRGKTDVSEELELIKTTVSQNGDHNVKGDSDEQKKEVSEKFITFKRLFTVAGNRKAFIINLLFLMIIYFGSYVIIMIYGQIIFEKINSGIEAHTCTMIYGVLQIVCNILTAFVIDKFGRRPLTLISGILSGGCLLIISVYFYLAEYTKVDVSHYGIYALCAILINTIATNMGAMPVYHVIQTEIFATEVKGLATCMIGIFAGIMSSIATKSYLMLAVTWRLGHCVPFFGFAVITWSCTALILKILPETKGKTLLQIQSDLNS